MWALRTGLVMGVELMTAMRSTASGNSDAYLGTSRAPTKGRGLHCSLHGLGAAFHALKNLHAAQADADGSVHSLRDPDLLQQHAVARCLSTLVARHRACARECEASTGCCTRQRRQGEPDQQV